MLHQHRPIPHRNRPQEHEAAEEIFYFQQKPTGPSEKPIKIRSLCVSKSRHRRETPPLRRREFAGKEKCQEIDSTAEPLQENPQEK